MERVSQAGCEVSIRVLSFKLVVVWWVLTTEDTESTEAEKGLGIFWSGQVVEINHGEHGGGEER